MCERADLDRAGYVPGYGTAAGQYMAVRTASNSADFFLPHLRPGMNVLDCGCGSGTITTGLAEVVSPGEVVGVDHEPVQVEQARALAAERGVDNVRFETADVFALPFADGTFDAAFAHAVLMHVGDRAAALREMRRVVRPGGVVAIKDLRGEDQIMEPSTPLLREFFDLLDRVRAHHGVPQSSPQLYRALMRESGLTDVEASASCRSYPRTSESDHRAAPQPGKRHRLQADGDRGRLGNQRPSRRHLQRDRGLVRTPRRIPS